ncbi:MAG: TOBE domain-containing protein, partial [Actinobacteria bacterium]|nr:TOBE domain-containing protein [Actinomycetota bacterium]
IAAKVAEALDMVQMSKLAERKPRQMSGGQQQRVAVARALVNRPSVLLLDEPLGALDRKLREEMQIELKLLQSRLGITFVFVTHDQEEAMSMSDRIAIMLDGHIEQLGDPETVYEHPSSAFVAGFIGRNNFWQGVATEHGIRSDDGTEFLASRPEEDVPNGEQALAAVRPESIDLSTEQPTSSANSTRGTVAGVSHFGDALQYVVSTGERDIIVLVPRDSRSIRHPLGETVWCSWPADDVYLFSARQAHIVMTESDES